jgi:RNase H-like domain found in reverse transcriptase
MAFVGREDHLLPATDPSKKAIGGSVFKIKKSIDKYKDSEEMLDDMQIVAFVWSKLTKTEQCYLVITKELLAIVKGLKNPKHILLSSR